MNLFFVFGLCVGGYDSVPIEWRSFNLLSTSTIRIEYFSDQNATKTEITVTPNIGSYYWDTSSKNLSPTEQLKNIYLNNNNN